MRISHKLCMTLSFNPYKSPSNIPLRKVYAWSYKSYSLTSCNKRVLIKGGTGRAKIGKPSKIQGSAFFPMPSHCWKKTWTKNYGYKNQPLLNLEILWNVIISS